MWIALRGKGIYLFVALLSIDTPGFCYNSIPFLTFLLTCETKNPMHWFIPPDICNGQDWVRSKSEPNSRRLNYIRPTT